MQYSFGLLVQNIGPRVAFIDAEQADPAPTNMKLGIYSRLYQDDNNSLHLMFDANKLLVATYTEMDWNGDGKIGNGFTEEQNEECRLNQLKMDVLVGLVHLQMKMMNMLILMNGINQFILHG